MIERKQNRIQIPNGIDGTYVQSHETIIDAERKEDVTKGRTSMAYTPTL